ncbi:MAG: LLM class F420-dependent oxidoreductase [Candidatus Promineifilaceae bacterium]|nr:LLM class F420-dependent oxidoreductase [Candidatus Promineifilaceae bacterium]
MRVGLQIPRFTWPDGPEAIAPRLAEIAQAAEEAGFYSMWVMDHFFQIPGMGEVDEPMLEGYSALSYLAAVTEHIRLGTLVTGVIYRYPGFLIKQVNTLDVLSGGRAYFGVGAGWFEREAKGLGFPFPTVAERFERLEEVLQIAHQMWAGDFSPFHGEHYQLEEPLSVPQPLSEPHPPILIGGMGEKKTLRLVAQYADACNLFTRAGLDTLRHKLDVLREHCEAVGRPYDEIEKTALGTVHVAPGEMTATDVMNHCRDLAQLGFDHAIFNMPNVHEIMPLDVFGKEIIPAVSSF